MKGALSNNSRQKIFLQAQKPIGQSCF